MYVFRDYLALNVYVAQCYFKLNYFDMSQVSDTRGLIKMSISKNKI